MSCAEWISLVDVIITAFLTAVIICQTKRLNEQQQQAEKESAEQQRAFEARLNQQQIELQKRQIQVDTFPYKREIYAHVFSVLALCNMLKELTKSIDLKSKSAVQLKEMFDQILEQHVPDVKQTLWSMRESEYILPKNISASVIDIKTHFDSLCAHLHIPSTLSGVLTEQELKEITNQNVDEAMKDCDAILDHAWFIESVLPKELDIAYLSK